MQVDIHLPHIQKKRKQAPVATWRDAEDVTPNEQARHRKTHAARLHLHGKSCLFLENY